MSDTESGKLVIQFEGDKGNLEEVQEFLEGCTFAPLLGMEASLEPSPKRYIHASEFKNFVNAKDETNLNAHLGDMIMSSIFRELYMGNTKIHTDARQPVKTGRLGVRVHQDLFDPALYRHEDMVSVSEEHIEMLAQFFEQHVQGRPAQSGLNTGNPLAPR